MAKREFLMQAHKYNPAKHDIRGWFVSEKLDGMRCFWDGGISRGELAHNIPWANTAKDKREFVATGLWSRKGKVIHAPSWWVDCLPPYPLDGELFAGRGERQTTMSYARKHTPVDSEWKCLKLHVFDSPPLNHAIKDGRYYDTNCDVSIENINEFYGSKNLQFKTPTIFNFALDHIHNDLNSSYIVHTQTPLPDSPSEIADVIARKMDTVLSLGGEGLVFRNPSSFWVPSRSHDVLKMKPYFDDEATVIGYVSGRETDRGSKLRGLMGALVVDYNGKRLELSGFTDRERRLEHFMTPSYGEEYAWDNPGVEMPTSISAKEFPRGSTVTFKYRELSKDGIPIEASYFRKHLEG